MARDRLAAIRAQQQNPANNPYSPPSPPTRPQFDQRYAPEAFGQRGGAENEASTRQRQLSARRPSEYQPPFSRGISPNQELRSTPPREVIRHQSEDSHQYQQHRSVHSPTPQDFDPRSSISASDGRYISSYNRRDEVSPQHNSRSRSSPGRPPPGRSDNRSDYRDRQSSHSDQNYQQVERGQNRRISFQGDQQAPYSQQGSQNSQPQSPTYQQDRQNLYQPSRQNSYQPHRDNYDEPPRQELYPQHTSRLPQSISPPSSPNNSNQNLERPIYASELSYQQTDSTNQRRPSGRGNRDRLESQETLEEKYIDEKSSDQGKKKSKKKGKKTIGKGDVLFEPMEEYFDEISDLQTSLQRANATIKQISTLHSRRLALPSSDDPQGKTIGATLETESTQLRAFLSDLKNRIFILEQGNANLGALIPLGLGSAGLSLADVDVRARQLDGVKEKFKSAIQNYADVERESREKSRNRMERSVLVLNPNLSQQEVIDVVRNAEGGGEDMFSSALLAKNQRSGRAKGALKEVQNRAKELAKIEETLIGLGQLFTDMALLVESQDVQVQTIERNAEATSNDVQIALVETKKAVVHAKSTRKMRKICFVIFLIIIIIVVLVVVFEVVLPMIKKNQAQNNSTPPSPSSPQNVASSLTTESSSTSITSLTTDFVGSSTVYERVIPSTIMSTVLLTRPGSMVASATNIAIISTVTSNRRTAASASIIDSIISDPPLLSASSQSTSIPIASATSITSTIAESLTSTATPSATSVSSNFTSTGNQTSISRRGMQKRWKFVH